MKKLLLASSWFTIVLLVIFIFMLSFDVSVIYCKYDNHSNQVVVNTNLNLQEEVASYEEDNLTVVESLRRKYDNQDVIGVLSIENTNIDEVVMQTSDNDYYLSHDKDKSYDIHGSIYMDYRINLDSSRKILIYGHSSLYDGIDEVPFNELEEYYDKEFYEEHKYIKLELDNEVRQYEIFSVYVETSDFTYMNLNFDSEYEYLSHIFKLKNRSLYDTLVDISSDDEILILQTCSNSKKYAKYKNKYLLVIAKRIK